MRYIGGKYRVRKKISNYLSEFIQDTNSKCFVEPFVGSANIVYSVMTDNSVFLSESHKLKLILNDFHTDLILMWKAIVYDGWEPPEYCTEKEYEVLRNAEPSALRGFIGHSCSFGGIWFSKFAKEGIQEKKKKVYEGDCLLDLDEFGEEPEPELKEARNFCKNAKNGIVTIGNCLKQYNTELYNVSYDELEIPDGSVIYNDPPYIGTAKPGSGNEFDHEKFWQWVRDMSKNNEVFVSEYTAPDDFECVLEIPVTIDMNREERVERLFKYKG